MSPRYCDEKEINLISLWAVDIYDLFCILDSLSLLVLQSSDLLQGIFSNLFIRVLG